MKQEKYIIYELLDNNGSRVTGMTTAKNYSSHKIFYNKPSRIVDEFFSEDFTSAMKIYYDHMGWLRKDV